MNEEEKVILDIIPIYKNEMYPTKEAIWHYAILNEPPYIREIAFQEIKHQFADCDTIIVLEKGMVIEIL